MLMKVTDAILPTTMIGSYPKPRWFEEYNLVGADLLEWWKLEKHFQAYRDATRPASGPGARWARHCD